MKKNYFLAFLCVTFLSLVNSGFVNAQSGIGHDPTLVLSYTPTGYTAATTMRQDNGYTTFAKSNISNDGLQYLEKFTNLTRLQLEKTEVGDEGIRKLAKLEHIEALNLYGTKISNTSLDYLAKIQSLKRVYLWQTDITASKVTELKEKNKALEVIF